MRRLGTVLVVLAAAAPARAVPPPVVPLADVGTHAGEIVTVEADVSSAHTTGDTCILEFGTDASAFRAVLLVPLFSSLPARPDRLYEGKRVRVSGRVQRFQGRPEMILQNPEQIEVVDVGRTAAAAEDTPPIAPPRPVAVPAVPPATAPPPAVPPTTAPSPPAPIATPTIAPPPAPAPASTIPPAVEAARPEPAAPPPPAPESPPRGLVEAIGRRVAQGDPCGRARARWREAAATTRERAAALDRCLAGGGYRCRTEAAAIAPALSALEWSEQAVDDACP